jgi:hypothetical protein
MVGNNGGALFDDHTVGSLSSIEGGGGLVGVSGGTIVSSSSSARISGPGGGGGLVWHLIDGEITTSYAAGSVTGGTKSTDGGLVGLNAGGIANSYATGDVTGRGSSVVGGLMGEDTGTGWSYSVGQVSGGSGSSVGGFVGDEEVVQYDVDCYWDTSTSGTDKGTGNQGNVPGITGMTTLQLQSGLPAGFDPTIWAEDPTINSGFPYLIANPPK